ncbi:MAG: hypothetical protein DYG94_00325 [Leptolyngbya sp. PLA3]|nr:MAG: hypothetical protein EDM82_01550 [Cyanobacteria bacterium CYA]MCE7967181.1 hypothetical protein [Leptolyngbya sp. PL-A3]
MFERIMREAGKCVEQRGGDRLYKCFIEGAFNKARGGGHLLGLAARGQARAGPVRLHAHRRQAGPAHRRQGLRP